MGILNKVNGNRLQQLYHLSSSQIHNQIADIKFEIDDWLTWSKPPVIALVQTTISSNLKALVFKR